jgi:hypothetical protein
MADIPEHLLDKRTVERHVQKGVLKRQDVQQFLESLPDRSDNAEVVSAVDSSSEQNEDHTQQSSQGTDGAQG